MDWKIIAAIIGGAFLVVVIGAIRAWWRRGRYARKGRAGEKIVSKELSRLNKRNNIVINNVLLSVSAGRTSQIDHVVVSTKGIFVIETKNLAGRISGSEHAQNWQQHSASLSRAFFNPLLQNKGHVKALRKLLPDVDEDLFVSVVVFTDAWRLDIKADDIILHRRFLPDKRIRRTFILEERQKKRWWRRGSEVVLDEHIIVTGLDGLTDEFLRRKNVISSDDINEISKRILSANLMSRSAQRHHTEYARETSRNVSREIRSGICPRCGGTLVMRKGSGGDFVGCANYPTCRFVTSIDNLR